ncbi:hypothetical protein BSLG_000049 [Batrachochytrium salamandrivorans]|nr:hypothetical protein BSLG_000049 [Batrachochytrium salamandrivorans]
MSRKNLARYSLSDDPQQQPYRRSLRPLAMCHCNGDGQCGLYGCDESLSENNFYKRSTSEDLRRRKTTDADYVCEDHSRRPTPPPRLNHSQSKLGLAKSIASSLMQKVAKRLSVASLRSTGSFTDHTGSGGIYPNSTHVSGDESTSAGKGNTLDMVAVASVAIIHEQQRPVPTSLITAGPLKTDRLRTAVVFQ